MRCVYCFLCVALLVGPRRAMATGGDTSQPVGDQSRAAAPSDLVPTSEVEFKVLGSATLQGYVQSGTASSTQNASIGLGFDSHYVSLGIYVQHGSIPETMSDRATLVAFLLTPQSSNLAAALNIRFRLPFCLADWWDCGIDAHIYSGFATWQPSGASGGVGVIGLDWSFAFYGRFHLPSGSGKFAQTNVTEAGFIFGYGDRLMTGDIADTPESRYAALGITSPHFYGVTGGVFVQVSALEADFMIDYLASTSGADVPGLTGGQVLPSAGFDLALRFPIDVK